MSNQKTRDICEKWKYEFDDTDLDRYWSMVRNEIQKLDEPPETARELGIFLYGATPIFSTWQINPRHGRRIARGMGFKFSQQISIHIGVLEDREKRIC